jgi:hypothetical protein
MEHDDQRVNPRLDERVPGRLERAALEATRVWLPLAIAVVGVALIGAGGFGPDSPLAVAGMVLVGCGLMVWMLNWLLRMSVESNRDREREEEAREYFSRTGHWPEEQE